MKKRIFAISLLSHFLLTQFSLFSMEKKEQSSPMAITPKKKESPGLLASIKSKFESDPKTDPKDKRVSISCPEKRLSKRESKVWDTITAFETQEEESKRKKEEQKQIQLKLKENEEERRRLLYQKKSLRNLKKTESVDPYNQLATSPKSGKEEQKLHKTESFHTSSSTPKQFPKSKKLEISETKHERKRSKTESDLSEYRKFFVDDVEEATIEDATAAVKTGDTNKVTSLLGALSFAKKSEEEEIFSQEIDGKSTIKIVDQINEKEKKLQDLFKQLEETQEEVNELGEELRQRKNDKLLKQLKKKK